MWNISVDWTVYLDDGLCQRTTTCTLCGQRLVHGAAGWLGVVEVAALSMTVLLCAACQHTDATLERTMALLTARYCTREEDADGRS